MRADDFPRQFARTRRFQLGVPNRPTPAPDGRRVVFLRTRDGADPMSCLWLLDVLGRRENLLTDPHELLAGEPEIVPPEEQARREAAREYATGITSYSTDALVRHGCFALSGRLWTVELADDARVHEVTVRTPVADPRLDPTGRRIAYVSRGALWVVDPDHGTDRPVAEPDAEDTVFGLPEYVAAEEIRRDRGHWWAPDGSRLLVARVDTAGVQRYWLTDPADPAAPPRPIAYPRAGTRNADVTLWLVDLAGNRVAVDWDRAAFEYLTAVTWHRHGLVIAVQSRDHRRLRLLDVDPATGRTSVRYEDTDDVWVRRAGGVPAFTASGALAWVSERDGARRLLIDGRPVTPAGLNVRAVLDVDGDVVLFAASTEQPDIQLWTWSSTLDRVTGPPGVHDGRMAGGLTVIASQGLDHDGTVVTVHQSGRPPCELAGAAETPVLPLRVELRTVGERRLPSALILPSWYERDTGPLPVLVNSYAGPASQRVLAGRTWWYRVSQWFAEQGFAVLIADGRGTPGRDPAWERSIRGDLATPVLDDQIDALRSIAARNPGTLDLDRVAIRGWSFGGYLAALAVLRRPDVFHAGIGGAGLYDQSLYDTYFKERYLGDPRIEPENYTRTSVLREAATLRRPLLLVHGLADANVVPANTFRLSAALLAAGRSHELLLLPGVTHMVAQPDMAERLLHAEYDFLRRALHP